MLPGSNQAAIWRVWRFDPYRLRIPDSERFLRRRSAKSSSIASDSCPRRSRTVRRNGFSDMDEPVKYIRGVGLCCSSLASGKQCGRRPRRSSRRLITLIFAGRNRIIVIRRELPRTNGAGWAERACRIEKTRALLSVFDSAAIRTAFLLWFSDLHLGCDLFRFAHLGFDVHSDGRDESEQLSPHRCYASVVCFFPWASSFGSEHAIDAGLPGDLFSVFAQPDLTFPKGASSGAGIEKPRRLRR